VAREQSLYGTGGDVAKMLPRLREDIDREMAAEKARAGNAAAQKELTRIKEQQRHLAQRRHEALAVLCSLFARQTRSLPILPRKNSSNAGLWA
jgi:hypothetical protein